MKMEQILVVDGNGVIRGECPKCKEWRTLEFAHSEYAAEKYTTSKGMFLCHSCNMAEKQVNPEKTPKERNKIARRDYRRKNLCSLSKNYGNGIRIRIQYNKKTGAVTICECTQKTLWSGNVGTDLPEIVYVVDGELEKE